MGSATQKRPTENNIRIIWLLRINLLLGLPTPTPSGTWIRIQDLANPQNLTGAPDNNNEDPINTDSASDDEITADTSHVSEEEAKEEAHMDQTKEPQTNDPTGRKKSPKGPSDANRKRKHTSPTSEDRPEGSPPKAPALNPLCLRDGARSKDPPISNIHTPHHITRRLAITKRKATPPQTDTSSPLAPTPTHTGPPISRPGATAVKAADDLLQSMSSDAYPPQRQRCNQKRGRSLNQKQRKKNKQKRLAEQQSQRGSE